MKSNFKMVLATVLILAFTGSVLFFADTAANAAGGSNSVVTAQEDPEGMPPPQPPGVENPSGKPGKKPYKQGGPGKMQEAMFEVFKKYAGDPVFNTMLDEHKTIMDSMAKDRQAKMKQNRDQMQNLMMQYAIKAKAAKSEEEEQQIKSEMKTKFKAMMEKGRTEGKAAMEQHKTKMEAFKAKYESKFPDYFKVLEEHRKNMESRKMNRQSGKKGVNKGTGGFSK